MRVGIIGGGQLGMYLVEAAHKLGHTAVVLDPSVDGPASHNCDTYICAAYDDKDALRQLAKQSNVITYEFENVNADVIDYILERYNVKIPQGKRPLLISQHRIREKASINDVGIRTAEYMEISNPTDISFLRDHMHFPFIIKTCTGGYDGKGQWLIKNEVDIDRFKEEYHEDMDYIAEDMVDFSCEISVIAIRSRRGDIITYEPIENIHEHGILHLSISPARISKEISDKAKQVARDMMERLEFVGIVAIEMFVGTDNEIYVNEIAPRPHNSGHLTMDGYNVSQYENAIHAITDGELIPPEITTSCVMVNVLGQHLDNASSIKLPPNATLYLYGKRESKVNRKMGHITFTGDDIDEMIRTAEAAIK